MTENRLTADSGADADGTTAIDELRAFLDASPSPYHAVALARNLLTASGFVELSWRDDWDGDVFSHDRRDFVVVRDGALVAFRLPRPPGSGTSSFTWRLVGAHTDSPGLRVKPVADVRAHGWRQVAVEVYGGVLANSWLDRDLGVAGRLVRRDGSVELVRVDRPMARVPQLAVHLDRDVNDRGLVLDRQVHLAPVWGTDGRDGPESFLRAIVPDPDEVVAHDLCLYDVTPAAVLGGDRSLLASGRLDNLVSCWAATASLLAAEPADHGAMIVLFDHEEVGSSSTTGASGPLLGSVLRRIHAGLGLDEAAHLTVVGRSTCVSADNAHAVHPNYAERHEPGHRPLVNRGPAIKINANQRYATSAVTAAWFLRCCEAAGVPWQTFVSRNSMPCGSTIGPLAATRLGIDTVDVGVPQLSMHSARELCGVDDPLHLRAALVAYLGTALAAI